MPLCRFDLAVLENKKPAFLVGVDEAGRGPLAGPVTACAAWVPLPALPLISPVVNDSKKLTAPRRERALRLMLDSGVRFGFGFAGPREIDEVNILEATFNAMGSAVRRLFLYSGAAPSEALVLVDGPLGFGPLAADPALLALAAAAGPVKDGASGEHLCLLRGNGFAVWPEWGR